MVSVAGVNVTVDKLDAVALWSTLKCVREVHGFVGLANFYARFNKSITMLLIDLMKKGINFKWDIEGEAAFQALKKALTSTSILQIFNKEKPHKVWVAASDYAVGTTLV